MEVTCQLLRMSMCVLALLAVHAAAAPPPKPVDLNRMMLQVSNLRIRKGALANGGDSLSGDAQITTFLDAAQTSSINVRRALSIM